MELTIERIAELEAKGFKRWQKGNFDRLYINAEQLGLECEYYGTGNISYATFNGEKISNSKARAFKAYKTYIDVKTGEIHTNAEYTIYKDAVKALIEA